MNIKIIAAVIIFSSIFCNGQNSNDSTKFNYHRDYENILKRTQDKSDPYYYDTLLNRFLDNSYKLTDYEILVMLIGFTGKDEYKPYTDIEIEREIYNLYDSGDFEKAFDLCENYLKTHPVSFSANREMAYCYSKYGDSPSTVKYLRRYSKIAGSMIFSGDGTTFEKAHFSLNPMDGQILIKYYFHEKIGIVSSGEDDNGYFYDIIEMKLDNSDNSKILYFNIDHAKKKCDLSKQNKM